MVDQPSALPRATSDAAGVASLALRDVYAQRTWPGIALPRRGGGGGDEAAHLVGAVTCRYAAWSRRVMRARGAALAALAEGVEAERGAGLRALALAEADLATWASIWQGRIGPLLAAAAAGEQDAQHTLAGGGKVDA